MFDFIKLKRDPKTLSKALVLESDTYVSKEAIRILIPKRYMKAGFLTIDTVVKTLGIFIFITEDYKYSVCSIPLTLELNPHTLETITIGNKEYFLLHFNKGDTVINTNKLIRSKDFVFGIIDEFLIKGNTPFFLEYEDIPNIFSVVRKYTGSDVADDISSITALTSLVARHPDNTYFRTDTKKPLKMIALNNPLFRYHDTFSKLTANYLKKGVISALNRPEKEATIQTEVYTY